MIAGDALRPGIERGFAVHEEAIMMVAMAQRQLRVPGAIGMALHRVRTGMPVIEIAGDKHFLGVRGGANEVDRLAEISGGVTIPGDSGVKLGRCILFTTTVFTGFEKRFARRVPRLF